MMDGSGGAFSATPNQQPAPPDRPWWAAHINPEAVGAYIATNPLTATSSMALGNALHANLDQYARPPAQPQMPTQPSTQPRPITLGDMMSRNPLTGITNNAFELAVRMGVAHALNQLKANKK